MLFYNQSFQVKFTFLSTSEYIGRLDNLCGGGWCLKGWGRVRKTDIENGHIWIYRVSSRSYLSHCAYWDVMEAGDRAWGRLVATQRNRLFWNPVLWMWRIWSKLLWPIQHLTWWSGHHLKLIVQNSTLAFFLPFHYHEYLFSIYFMVGLLQFILLISPPVY